MSRLVTMSLDKYFWKKVPRDISNNKIKIMTFTPTSAVTFPRLTIKGQKVGSGPIPGNLDPFSKTVGIILQLISL